MPLADRDEELVQRGRNGDASARRTLVERHVDTVYRVAYRLTRTRSEAEDIAQDVLARMLDYREGWLSPISFRVWIRRAVLNRVIDASRSRQRWSIMRPLDDGLDVADGQPDAEAAAETNQQASAVANAVRALPARQKMVIVLCHYENLSLADAAAAMKTSVGAVEQLLQRAKAALRVELRALEP
ncbi:MAG: sigma-70 family RNA polymerase sigma factor [Rhodospirillaceae bacterium]|nr:sigma-70 family RNA polymerase sigma factor [Rhodospirillaceae bacterium]